MIPPGHPLHKVFNRKTVKLSYSTMPNMLKKISVHSSKATAGAIAESADVTLVSDDNSAQAATALVVWDPALWMGTAEKRKIVKLCVHFCVCVSKSLRKWTQTDTKVTFHPPPPPTRKLFLVSNERYGKNKTFLLR